MFYNQVISPPNPGADTPQPATKLAPEAIVDQLRALRQQIGDDLSPLTREQRTALVERSRRQPNPVLQSSINIIGAADLVSQAVGLPAAVVRQMCDDSNRWTAVADELRGLLNGVEGANVVRQQRLADIARRAYTIGSSLATDPVNVALVPHVEETKRLRKLARRKKSAAPTPVPQPSPTNVPKA